MAKAIAIFDEPKKCTEGSCPCNYDGVACTLDDLAGHEMTEDGSIPDWCPLIPEPAHIKIKETDTFIEQVAYRMWNACLDALEGKRE